jgi:hypothetical protein
MDLSLYLAHSLVCVRLDVIHLREQLFVLLDDVALLLNCLEVFVCVFTLVISQLHALCLEIYHLKRVLLQPFDFSLVPIKLLLVLVHLVEICESYSHIFIVINVGCTLRALLMRNGSFLEAAI